jgi:hypothetical protein
MEKLTKQQEELFVNYFIVHMPTSAEVSFAKNNGLCLKTFSNVL